MSATLASVQKLPHLSTCRLSSLLGTTTSRTAVNPKLVILSVAVVPVFKPHYGDSFLPLVNP